MPIEQIYNDQYTFTDGVRIGDLASMLEGINKDWDIIVQSPSTKSHVIVGAHWDETHLVLEIEEPDKIKCPNIANCGAKYIIQCDCMCNADSTCPHFNRNKKKMKSNCGEIACRNLPYCSRKHVVKCDGAANKKYICPFFYEDEI